MKQIHINNTIKSSDINIVAASVVCPCLWAFCPEKEPATCTVGQGGKRKVRFLAFLPFSCIICDIKC